MSLRQCVFWLHLTAGVCAGVVILIMCVTGVLLTYERQMIAWSDREFRSAPTSAGTDRLDVETLLTRINQANPEIAPTAITLGSASDSPAVLTVPQRTLYLDSYSGRLLGEGSQTMRRFMSDLRAWHRWLAREGDGRGVARAITGWSNVVFAFIVLSGMYLWIPRTWVWQQVKAVLLFRGRLRGKARDFNWHNVIGIWSAVPLFIVVVSAVPISFSWGNALVYRIVGEEPPAREGGGARGRATAARPRGGQREDRARGEGSRDGDRVAAIEGLNALWARAEGQVPGWKTINLRIPASPEAPVVFTIDRGDGGQPQLRSTLTLDRRGEVIASEAFPDQTLGRRLRSIMRFAHTGEVLGIPGQTVAGLVSAGGAVLVWTGLALAWRRFRSWQKRRRVERIEELAEERSSAA